MRKIDKALIGLKIHKDKIVEDIKTKRIGGESHLIAIITCIGVVLVCVTVFKEEIIGLFTETVFPSVETEVTSIFSGTGSGSGTTTP